MRGFSLYQFRHGVYALKIFQLEILIGNGNPEVLFEEQYELHSKHGVDEPGGKDLIIIGNRASADVPPQESPEFFFRLLHEISFLQD
jgi:hypothetical protein